MTAIYLLGRRRAQAQAKRERDDLIDRFEAINDETLAELRSLRCDIARLHEIESALETERDQGGWLN
jgi:hypothetical protein